MEQGTGNREQVAGNAGRGFRKLRAWQSADDLASAVFRLTENEIAPGHRWLGLQIVRSGSLAALEELRWKTGNLLFGLSRSLRGKLEAKGEWQRGLIKDEEADYGTEVWDGEALFRVPGSMFPDAEV